MMFLFISPALQIPLEISRGEPSEISEASLFCELQNFFVGQRCHSRKNFTLPVNIDDDSFLDSLPDVIIDLLCPEPRVCNLAYLGIHAAQDAAFGIFSRIAGMDADA